MANVNLSRRLILTLATIVLLTLILSCGGDDDADSVDDSGGEPTAEATTDSTSDDSGDDDGDGGSSGGDDLDVCSLITEGEASEALGEKITSTEPTTFPPLYSCTYDSENGVITLTVVTGTREEVEAIYEVGTEGYEQVDGVGEKAHWSGSPADTLEVLEGDYNVSISVFSLGEEELDYKQLSIDLAGSALDRLP